MAPTLFAVHLSDGVMTPFWITGGFIVAAVLIAIASFRVRDEEIPRIGMLSAAIFIGSQIHLPLGVTSVHLLLNGLTGVLLGRRAPLAIAVGLTLQAILFGHGGKWAWGLNVCILSIPAILAGLAFPFCARVLSHSPQIVRLFIVSISVGFYAILVLTAIQITAWKIAGKSPRLLLEDGKLFWIADPIVLLLLFTSIISVSGIVTRRHRANQFITGLLLGMMSGVLTVALNATAIYFGGIDGVRVTAPIAFLAHTPIIAAESLGVATVVSYLAKVKPEWLIRRAN